MILESKTPHFGTLPPSISPSGVWSNNLVAGENVPRPKREFPHLLIDRSRSMEIVGSSTDGFFSKIDSKHQDILLPGQWSRRLPPGTHIPSPPRTFHRNRLLDPIPFGHQGEKKRSFSKPSPDFCENLLPGNCLYGSRFNLVQSSLSLLCPCPVNFFTTWRIEALEQSIHQIYPILTGKRKHLIG